MVRKEQVGKRISEIPVNYQVEESTEYLLVLNTKYWWLE